MRQPGLALARPADGCFLMLAEFLRGTLNRFKPLARAHERNSWCETLRWRGQRKLKVGIQRRLEALLPGVPPVETTARAMAVLGYAVRLVAQCREAIRLAPIQAAQHGPPLVWRSRQVP